MRRRFSILMSTVQNLGTSDRRVKGGGGETQSLQARTWADVVRYVNEGTTDHCLFGADCVK